MLSREGHTPLEMLRAMYAGHCGYMSETGGIMKNLRESCSHTKVRQGEGYQGRATHLEMLRAMYPGHCGYMSETGGHHEEPQGELLTHQGKAGRRVSGESHTPRDVEGYVPRSLWVHV